MKKILIISYFFPPCSLTASRRIEGWVKHLHEFGYYPIVVTRKWEKTIKSGKDMHLATSGGVEIIKDKSREVHYLPYKPNLRDRLYHSGRYSVLQKIMSFLELVFQNLHIRFCPFNNLYYHADKMISENDDIKKVIVSANPFVQFSFAYRLKKKHKYIKWIADYRDDWTTSELIQSRSCIQNIIHSIEKKSEQKWLSNAEFITSVSKYYSEKIGANLNKKSHVILHGFDESTNALNYDETIKGKFELTYNGTLYHSQPIEPILNSIKKIIDQYQSRLHIHLNFPGLAFDDTQRERVSKCMVGYENNYTATDRIPRSEVLQIQQRSKVLIMISHGGMKGVPSSKLYEYLQLQKPILLYPDDQDIVHETITDTGTGIICKNENEIFIKISNLIDEYLASGEISMNIKPERISNYTRKKQTQKLANLLDHI